MSTTETKEKKLRTQPRKKAHRKIIEMALTPQTTRMLLSQLEILEKAQIRALKDMEDFVLENVVENVIEAGNAHLPPTLQQTSLVLYSQDGKTRFAVNQQRTQSFDDRAQQATALIHQYITEHKNEEIDADSAFLVGMLEAMMFGASRKKKFRWTPELKAFMAMKDEELPDERLIQARDILNDAYFTSRGRWYYGLEKCDDKRSEFISLEEFLGY